MPETLRKKTDKKENKNKKQRPKSRKHVMHYKRARNFITSETRIHCGSGLKVVDEFDEGEVTVLAWMFGAQVCKLILGVHVVDGDHALLH